MPGSGTVAWESSGVSTSNTARSEKNLRNCVSSAARSFRLTSGAEGRQSDTVSLYWRGSRTRRYGYRRVSLRLGNEERYPHDSAGAQCRRLTPP